jgi:Arc/MetJ-type ribon-helix-helix transcriptional regulator
VIFLPERGYTNITVPKELANIIRTIVYGEQPSIYTSMADFVKEALREKIEKYETSRTIRKGTDIRSH